MRIRMITGVVGVLAAALLLGACGGGSSGRHHASRPVISGMTMPTTVEINEVSPLTVTASDRQGRALTYQWSSSAGTLTADTSPTCLWTAPATTMNGVQISVTVTNDAGRKRTSTRSVDVIDTAGTVTAAVRDIVGARCASCHVQRPTNHTGARDIEQCGACHVPYGNTTAFTHTSATTGCVGCHPTPADTHFFLRDDTDQTVYKAGVEAKCIACHRDGGHETRGHGRPTLDTDPGILASARQGTLRSWIQPGGFMAKYLTAAEVTAITGWIDTISENRVLGYDPYLNASSTADFTINGLGDNPAWSTATEHVVQVEPTIYTDTTQIKMKALYSSSSLYIRVEYDESTLSMTRSGSWLLSGGTWRHPIAASENDKQSEDRVAFFWNLSVNDFRDRYGCAVKCHGNVPGSACFTDLTGAKADLWHTKAARAMGVTSRSDSGSLTVDFATEAFEVTAGTATFTGFSDDKWLTSYMNLADGYDTEDSGRRGDAGSSMYSHNRNGTKTAPLYLETAPTSWSDAMVLTKDEVTAGLVSGDVLVADPGDPGYDATAVANAWINYATLHAVVPERILRVPSGSRGDLLFAASWRNGTWVNEFKRPLDTTNPDDVSFETSGATEYPFSIAIFDNCGRGEIPPGHTTYGNGRYQILTFK